MAMFSEDSLIDYITMYSSSYYYNLLSDSSRVIRFDLSRSCFSNPLKSKLSAPNDYRYISSPFISVIISNLNYISNSFEVSTKYYNCEHLFELFCNPSIKDRYLTTHSIFDCEDFFPIFQSSNNLDLFYLNNIMNISNNYSINQNISKPNNGLKLFSLSVSSSQIEIALNTLINQYQIDCYAVVYSTDTTSSDASYLMYQKLAANLVYKMSVNSNLKLQFSVSMNDPTLDTLLVNQSLNISEFFRFFVKIF